MLFNEDRLDVIILDAKQAGSHQIPNFIDLQDDMLFVPEPMEIPDLEKKLNSRLLIPQLDNISIEETRISRKSTTYFGELSEGSYTHVKYNDKSLSLIQRRIIEAHSSMLFIYPEAVLAYNKKINNWNATIVIPPIDLNFASFAILISGDIYLDITFMWKAKKSEIEEILSSI